MQEGNYYIEPNSKLGESVCWLSKKP